MDGKILLVIFPFFHLAFLLLFVIVYCILQEGMGFDKGVIRIVYQVKGEDRDYSF